MTRLEKDGWARREVSESDRRAPFTILTDEGMAVMRRIAPGHVASVRPAIVDRPTPEQVEQFGGICEAIAERPEPESGRDLPWLR